MLYLLALVAGCTLPWSSVGEVEDECDSDYAEFVDYNSSNITDCDFCSCSDKRGYYEIKCDPVGFDKGFGKIRDYCELDCTENSDVVYTDCGCPTCQETDDTNGDTGNDDDDDDNEDDEDDEDDDLYAIGKSEEPNDKFDDSPSLEASFEVEVTKIWNSRRDVWDILENALKEIVKEELPGEPVKLYVTEFTANVIDDETDSAESNETDETDETEEPEETEETEETTEPENTYTAESEEEEETRAATTEEPDPLDPEISDRRRLLEDNEDDRDISEEKTVQFEFEITIFIEEDDEEGALTADLFQKLVTLAQSGEYAIDYSTNCRDDSTAYSIGGFGSVTVSYASLTLVDEDGNDVEFVEYPSNGEDDDDENDDESDDDDDDDDDNDSDSSDDEPAQTGMIYDDVNVTGMVMDDGVIDSTTDPDGSPAEGDGASREKSAWGALLVSLALGVVARGVF